MAVIGIDNIPDLDQAVEYVHLFGNTTTPEKACFFLELHKETLMLYDASVNPQKSIQPRIKAKTGSLATKRALWANPFIFL